MTEIPSGIPYLEHYPKAGGPVRRTALDPLPFIIGRGDSAQLRIDSTQVSREHARVCRALGEMRIEDLGSTNGTFVNGLRVHDVALEHGDIVHIATLEFTYFSGKAVKTQAAATQVVAPDEARAAQLGSAGSVIRAVRRFQEMLAHRCVRILFQPIVDLETDEPLGYVACSGADFEPGRSPADHLLMATESRWTDRLSQLVRMVAAEQAASLPLAAQVFVPLHASEVGHAGLMEAICDVQSALTGDQTLVLEIPESAVADGPFMSAIHEQLAVHGVSLAYSGFGSGKSRLAELLTAPPEYLKLDKSLVHGLRNAKGRRQQFKETVATCSEQGVRVIATGVDSHDDARECRSLGCHAAQGNWFGKPEPLAEALALDVELVRAGH